MSEEKEKPKMNVIVVGSPEIGKTAKLMAEAEKSAKGVVVIGSDLGMPEPTMITNPYAPEIVQPYVQYKSGKEMRRERRERERKQKKSKK